MRLVVTVLALAGCASSKPPPKSSPAPAACLADGLGALKSPPELDTACLADDSCARACAAGTADACMARGYSLQQDPAREGEARPLYATACRLGLAIGCTNYGAGLWLSHQPASAADEACASRLFDRSCEVREQFGCGMAGRMMAAGAETPEQKEAARQFFDRTCTQLGAMSCRMYAHHLERGDFGPFEPATVRALMHRACETGDEDACGRETATETFH